MKKIKIKIGEIIADYYYPDKEINNTLIIFCPGLPGSWKYEDFAKGFVSKGFSFIHPKYIGSWESFGRFSIKKCKKTIEEILENKIKDGNFNKIFLLGHSFGGSISLVVGAEKNIEGIISLAPIIDFRMHNNNKNESDLRELFKYINNSFGNIFRGFNEQDWIEFCKTGYNINPIDFTEKLNTKKILLIHGKKDQSVDIEKTRNFYLKLKEHNKNVKFIEFNDADHSNIRDKSIDKIINWIK